MSATYDPLKLSEFFKVLGDITRVRIILLLKHGALNVSEIARLLNMEQSAISHQLRTLYLYRAVTYEKQGKERFYKILDPHIFAIIDQADDHLKE